MLVTKHQTKQRLSGEINSDPSWRHSHHPSSLKWLKWVLVFLRDPPSDIVLRSDASEVRLTASDLSQTVSCFIKTSGSIQGTGSHPVVYTVSAVWTSCLIYQIFVRILHQKKPDVINPDVINGWSFMLLGSCDDAVGSLWGPHPFTQRSDCCCI